MAESPNIISVHRGSHETTFDFVKGSAVLQAKSFSCPNPAISLPVPPTVINFEGDKRFDDLIQYARDLSHALKTKSSKELIKLGLSKTDSAELLKSSGQLREERIVEIFDSQIHEKYGDYDADVSGNSKAQALLAPLGIDYNKLKDMAPAEAQEEMRSAMKAKVAEIGEEETKKLLFKVQYELQTSMDEADKKYEKATVDGVEYTKLMGKGSENPDIGLICRHTAPIMGSMLSAANKECYVFHCRFDKPEITSITGKMGNGRHASVWLPEFNNIAESTEKSKLCYKKTAMVISDKDSDGKCFIFYDKKGEVHSFDNIPYKSTLELIGNEQRFPDQIAKVNNFLQQHKGGAAEAFKEQVEKNSRAEALDYSTLPSALDILVREQGNKQQQSPAK